MSLEWLDPWLSVVRVPCDPGAEASRVADEHTSGGVARVGSNLDQMCIASTAGARDRDAGHYAGNSHVRECIK